MSQPFPLPADRQLRKHLLLCGLLVVGVGGIGLYAVSSYLDHLTALQTAVPQLAAEHYVRLLRVCGWLHIAVPIYYSVQIGPATLLF
jgi:hypothetical protein